MLVKIAKNTAFIAEIEFVNSILLLAINGLSQEYFVDEENH